MQYQKYRAGKEDALVGAYKLFIGEREPDDRPTLDANPKRTPRRVSRMIGRACKLYLDPTAIKGANNMLRRAVWQSDASIRTRDGRALRRLGNTARLLLASTSEEVRAVRKATHGEIINQIVEVRGRLANNQLQKHRSNLTGEISELVCLGLGTRQVHPSTLSVSALTHHDESSSNRNNHDMLLLCATPDDGVYETDFIQVKSFCLGLCDDDPTKLKTDRDEYASDVTFVSAHCDLSLPEGGLGQTCDLLISEYRDKASTRQIDTLDSLTGNLVLAMTMDDPRRMGQATVPMIIQAAA